MNRADGIVQALRPLPQQVQLQPHKDLHLPRVLHLERPGPGQILWDLLPVNAVVLLQRAVAVSREAEVGQPRRPGGGGHLLQGALPVVQSGVGMKISAHLSLSFSPDGRTCARSRSFALF